MKFSRLLVAIFAACCIGLVSGACSGQRVAPPVRQPRLVLSDGTPVNVATHPVKRCDESGECCAVPKMATKSRTYTVESPDGLQTWTSTYGGADGLRIVTVAIPAPKPLPPPVHRIIRMGGSSQEPPIPDRTNWGQLQQVEMRIVPVVDPDTGRFSPIRYEPVIEPFKVLDIPEEYRSLAGKFLVYAVPGQEPMCATYLRATRDASGMLEGVKLYQGISNRFSFKVLTEADSPMAGLVIGMIEDATSATVEYDERDRPSRINLFRD